MTAFASILRQNALPQVSLTAVVCVTSLLATVAAAKVFPYDCGTAAGLMAGAFTESTVIGTAGGTGRRGSEGNGGAPSLRRLLRRGHTPQ